MAKSIIDIEVNDGAWKSFNAQVEAHKKTVAKLPGQWGAVGQSVNKAQSAAAKLVARMQEQAKAFKETNSLAGKLALSLKMSDRMASSLARNTLTVAKNLKDATRSLLSWGSVMGLISGVLGAGGLFGITRMAQSVQNAQTNAQQTGSSYGGTQAAQLVYGQLLNGEGGVQSILSHINKQQESGGAMLSLYMGGQDKWKDKTPTEILPGLLSGMKDYFSKIDKSGRNTAFEQFKHQGMTPEGFEFGNLNQLLKQDLGLLIKQAASAEKELALSKSAQQAWSDFVRSISIAGQRIENIFAQALVPLSGPLAAFSKSLADATKTLMGSKLVSNLIRGAGEGLKSGAAYLSGDQFPKDMAKFLDRLEKIGKAIESTAEFLGRVFGPSEPMAWEIKKTYSDVDWMKVEDRKARGADVNFNPGQSGSALGRSFGNFTVTNNLSVSAPAGSRVEVQSQNVSMSRK